MRIIFPFMAPVLGHRNILFSIFIFTCLFLSGDFSALDSETNNFRKKFKRRKTAASGVLDFQTKMLLVFFSVFMLIFVIVLLIVGHFTWFADIKSKLAKEWEEEQAKIEEEDRVAKNILSEMKNPFVTDDIESGEIENEKNYRRRESLDSYGCPRGLCVSPHHSILCPNNPNVPSLSEPIENFHHNPNQLFYNNNNNNNFNNLDISPINYRRRPSTEWMNLDTCVRVSEPIPLRRDFKLFSMSTGSLIPKAPSTPITPDPVSIQTQVTSTHFNSDLERAERANYRYPSNNNFDISKLDIF